MFISVELFFPPDLCLDEETDNSNELEANRIQFVDLHMTNIASRRYQALCKQKHLCIELGGTCQQI